MFRFQPKKHSSPGSFRVNRGAVKSAFSGRSRFRSGLRFWLQPPRIYFALGAMVIIAGTLTVIGIVRSHRGTAPTMDQSGTLPMVTSGLPPRNAPANEPVVTIAPGAPRFIGQGAQDIEFKEKQINQPSVYDKQLIFSAGTGSVDGDVLKNLYLYDLDTGQEKKLSESKIYMGEYYETLINHDWIVWVETDHGINNTIYAQSRQAGSLPAKIKECPNGRPNLQLDGDVLIWMEQVDKQQDTLNMIDLSTQENLQLFTIQDVTSYGVSTPCIYNDTVVWSGPDPAQTAEDKAANGEKSAIYSVALNEDTFIDDKLNSTTFSPGTYVHDPIYNGQVYVWVDGNKSLNDKLYISAPGGEPKVIDSKVTTYSLGDGIVVYGKDQAIWVYVIATGETCRLTADGEKGMLPIVQNRTVVWYNMTASGDRDVLRFKILTDEELLQQWPEK